MSVYNVRYTARIVIYHLPLSPTKNMRLPVDRERNFVRNAISILRSHSLKHIRPTSMGLFVSNHKPHFGAFLIENRVGNGFGNFGVKMMTFAF